MTAAVLCALLLAAPPAPLAAPGQGADAALEVLAAEGPSVAPQWIGALRPRGGTALRIVTLAPHATELVFALGRGAEVVGVSRFDDAPPAVSALPRVGGFLDPSLEAVLALSPTLVVAAPNASVRPTLERLVALKVPVFCVPGNSLADAFHALRALGLALDRTAAAAQVEAGWWRALKLARSSARGTPVRTLILLEREPLIVAGPRSLLGQVFELLGARDIVRSAADYPTYSREQVVTDAPELLVDGSLLHAATTTTARVLTRLDADEQEGLGVLRRTPAVSGAHAYKITSTALLRPGPRLFEALGELRAAIAGAGR